MPRPSPGPRGSQVGVDRARPASGSGRRGRGRGRSPRSTCSWTSGRSAVPTSCEVRRSAQISASGFGVAARSGRLGRRLEAEGQVLLEDEVRALAAGRRAGSSPCRPSAASAPSGTKTAVRPCRSKPAGDLRRDREERGDVADAVLVEGDLDAGVERDAGRLVARQRPGDLRRRAGLEDPRAGERPVRQAQGGPVGRAGGQRRRRAGGAPSRGVAPAVTFSCDRWRDLDALRQLRGGGPGAARQREGGADRRAARLDPASPRARRPARSAGGRPRPSPAAPGSACRRATTRGRTGSRPQCGGVRRRAAGRGRRGRSWAAAPDEDRGRRRGSPPRPGSGRRAAPPGAGAAPSVRRAGTWRAPRSGAAGPAWSGVPSSRSNAPFPSMVAPVVAGPGWAAPGRAVAPVRRTGRPYPLRAVADRPPR